MLQLNYCEYLCPFTENTGDGYVRRFIQKQIAY